MNEKMPTEPKAISRVVTGLEKTCEQLHERLGELGDALSSVLKDPDSTTSGVDNPELECELANIIEKLNGRVFQASCRVQDITKRLEL